MPLFTEHTMYGVRMVMPVFVLSEIMTEVKKIKVKFTDTNKFLDAVRLDMALEKHWFRMTDRPLDPDALCGLELKPFPGWLMENVADILINVGKAHNVAATGHVHTTALQDSTASLAHFEAAEEFLHCATEFIGRCEVATSREG